mgnify:CR=1 FL=1
MHCVSLLPNQTCHNEKIIRNGTSTNDPIARICSALGAYPLHHWGNIKYLMIYV